MCGIIGLVKSCAVSNSSKGVDYIQHQINIGYEEVYELINLGHCWRNKPFNVENVDGEEFTRGIPNHR